MSYSVEAILVAIGTELSSGQICNTNTAWLASQLSEAGLSQILHWTAGDNRQLLQALLPEAVQHSPLVILTGGLGPTSDDFTREIVATLLQQKLQHDLASWQRLQQRAEQTGFELTPSQQQQCWFPAGAEVLPNPAGTADGFVCRLPKGFLVALPGPPREVQAIWPQVLSRLHPCLPAQPPRELHHWQCLGMAEGALGEAVDAAVAGSGFETGYRAHFPYIEVKLWTPPGALDTHWRQRIEAAMQPAYILPGAYDPVAAFWQSLPTERSVSIIDSVSGGQVTRRLQPGWPTQRQAALHLQSVFASDRLLPIQPAEIQLGLHANPSGLEQGVLISLQTPTQLLERQVPPVFNRRRDLQPGYFSELALLIWKEFLTRHV